MTVVAMGPVSSGCASAIVPGRREVLFSVLFYLVCPVVRTGITHIPWDSVGLSSTG